MSFLLISLIIRIIAKSKANRCMYRIPFIRLIHPKRKRKKKNGMGRNKAKYDLQMLESIIFSGDCQMCMINTALLLRGDKPKCVLMWEQVTTI
mmetsp:Transcript_10206/g.15179  ORF Transcript_10206/g.15179 Transcript_10206/m.15179 type:complete len:93 (-) Transcript_10206:307-585(-)